MAPSLTASTYDADDTGSSSPQEGPQAPRFRPILKADSFLTALIKGS
jgi:hypothetical protein